MYHLGIDKAHPYVLSAGSPGRIKRIANYLDSVEKIIKSDRGLITVHGKYKTMPVTAFSTGMGPSSVDITLPEIIEACDDPEMIILRLGTSGGLQSYLNIGDFVITTEAIRKESVCDKIMGKEYRAFADLRVAKVLEEKAIEYKESFQKVYVGPTEVTDEIYFNALNSKNKKHNAFAVSMEFSVYCALRDKYNKDYGMKIKTGNLLTVSDNVVKKQKHIDVKEFEEKQGKIEEAHIRIGLETLMDFFLEKFI